MDNIYQPTELLSALQFFQEFEMGLIYMIARAESGSDVFSIKGPNDLHKLDTVAKTAFKIKLDLTVRLQEAVVKNNIPVYGEHKQTFDKQSNPLINELTNKPLYYSKSDLENILKQKLKEDRIPLGLMQNSTSRIDETFEGVKKAFRLAIEQCLPVLSDNLIICNNYKSGGVGPIQDDIGGQPSAHSKLNFKKDTIIGWVPGENIIGKQSYKNCGPFI